MPTPLTYGSFNLNDGMNYFVLSRDISMVATNPTMFKIGRLDGMKKTGEAVNERKISLDVRILGVSRPDVEAKIDALQQALNVRGQQLTTRVGDARYFLADCVGFQAGFKAGEVLSVTARIDFICYVPYASSVSSSVLDSGIQQTTWNSTTSTYVYSQNVTAGGTVYCYPTIRIIQQTPALSTTLSAQLNNGSSYTLLSVAALPIAANAGDTLIIGTGSTKKTVVVSVFAPVGATTINVASFTSNAVYAVGTAVNKDLTMTAIQITEVNDNRILSITSNLPASNGDYIDVNCNPYDTTAGFTAVLNGGIQVSALNGVFPVMQPIATGFTFAINANSVPSIQVLWTFTSRWLS